MIVYGLVLAGATELFRDPRRTDNGIAAATSFWSLAFVLAGIGIVFVEGHRGESATITTVLAFAVVALAAACWRWGFAVYGYAAVAAAFLLLAQVPAARALWILAGALLVVVLPRGFGRASLASAYRTALEGSWVGGRRGSVLRRQPVLARSPLGRGSCAPPRGRRTANPRGPCGSSRASRRRSSRPSLVAWGIRSRRTLVLDTGVVLAALSLVTLRAYVHIAPLWVLLTAAGIVLVGAALALGRRLRNAPGGERRGFTARSFSSRRSGLEAAAVVAAFAPSAAPPRSPEPGGFSPGGGRYGGGGATGDF